LLTKAKRFANFKSFIYLRIIKSKTTLTKGNFLRRRKIHQEFG